MTMEVVLNYYDASGGGDTLEWAITLNEQEADAYRAALASGQDPNYCEALAEVLTRAQEAITAYEKKNMADWADDELIDSLDIRVFFPKEKDCN